MNTNAANVVSAALAAAAISAAAGAGVIVYEQDFSNPATLGWQLGGQNTSYTEALGAFSKRNGNNEVTLTVNTMQNETYTLVFDLYLFDSWSGNSSRWGQNTFTVRAEGHEIMRETFSNTGDPSSQSYAGSPDVLGQLGFGAGDDSVYRNITLTFNGRNPSVTLRFMGQGLGQLSDNSWALDNVRVYQGAAPQPMVPAPAGLALLSAGGLFAARRRRREATARRSD
jgi:hypothetical protein